MNSSIKLRVVIDTNVFISGLIWGGKPRLVLNKWLRRELRLLMSPYLAFEIVSTYEKFNNPKEDVENLNSYLATNTLKIIPPKKVTVCRDQKDNQVLDLCLAGGADFLVTGDKDLLDIKTFKRTRILKPKDFLKVVK